ncbi:MAG: hypothetical protein ACK5MA_07440 [Parachlamydiaceae bacterium]
MRSQAELARDSRSDVGKAEEITARGKNAQGPHKASLVFNI